MAPLSVLSCRTPSRVLYHDSLRRFDNTPRHPFSFGSARSAQLMARAPASLERSPRCICQWSPISQPSLAAVIRRVTALLLTSRPNPIRFSLVAFTSAACMPAAEVDTPPEVFFTIRWILPTRSQSCDVVF